MQFVDPIRDLKKLTQIKNVLRGAGNIRDLLLIELWINSALRCSDLLRIRVRDVFSTEGTIHEFFELHEQKTGKRSRIVLTPKVRGTLAEYYQKFPIVVSNQENFIFFPQKTFPLGSTHIGRVQSWKIINRVCKDVGLQWNFWNHSLRKTFGFQARQHSIPLELIQFRLNHSNLSVTMRYLAIRDEELIEACNKLDL